MYYAFCAFDISIATYAYDHTTERIKKTANSVTTIYPNDLWNKATSGATATTTRHIFDNQGTLLAAVEGNGTATTTRYLHPDHLNSTNAVSDSTGELLQTLDYYPYGDDRISTGSFTSQRQFIGEIKDQETDLSYLNARYYDGNRGQFTSQDPVFLNIGVDKRTIQVIRDPQLLNSYSYAGNNPLKNTDKTGELIDIPWISNSTWVQEAALAAYNHNATWKFAMDHPHITSVGVGAWGRRCMGSCRCTQNGVLRMHARIRSIPTTAIIRKISFGWSCGANGRITHSRRISASTGITRARAPIAPPQTVFSCLIAIRTVTTSTTRACEWTATQSSRRKRAGRITRSPRKRFCRGRTI
ncbi:RHS repeat-associated core domain-containing protein [Candidatus Kaiserbacteria bacterium]|nr:RHS repeat-associated core domain-containing protein [Candidatus Kaiserbacteria bacterium]